MTTAHLCITLAILVYLGCMLYVGYRCSKNNNDSADFYLGGRKLGPLVTAMSAEASDMSSWLLMGLPGLAYLTGVANPAWTAIGLGIGTWTKPLGGYFISFDSMDGCAKAIVARAKEAGVVLTGAGATYPYGKDPKDSNIRIAPSFPTLEDLGKAAQVFVLCVKLVSVEKLLG